MKVSIRWSTATGRLVVAGAIIISAGCASTSLQFTAPVGPAAAGPTARASAETPASAASLVDSARLVAQAEREGYKPVIQDGTVIYCWADVDTGSRISTKKCVGSDQMRELLLQDQQQRENAQEREAGNTACNAASC